MLKAFFARLKGEPALVGGLFVSVGQALVGAPTWASAATAVGFVLVRFFVSPADKIGV